MLDQKVLFSFQLIPNVLDEVKVSPLCRQVKFFLKKLVEQAFTIL